MSAEMPANPPAVITVDLACFACGYNLRTLSADAICPECASPVAESLRADRLVSDDAAWLRRLVRGTRLLCIASAVTAFLYVLTLVLFSVFPYDAVRWINWVYLVVPILDVAATWHVSSRETVYDTPGTRRLRTAARAFAVMALVVNVVDYFPVPFPLYYWLAPLIRATSGTLTLVWVRRHASRAPSGALRRFCSIMIGSAWLSAAWMIAFGVVTERASIKFLEATVILLQVYFFIAVAAYTTLSILLYRLFARVLREAQARGRAASA